MNVLTNLYFKYETMVKGPSSESRLHKPRPDMAEPDQFSAWHPQKACRPRKHQAANASRRYSPALLLAFFWGAEMGLLRSVSAPKLPQYREKQWGDSIHDPVEESRNIIEEVVDMTAAFEV